MRSMTYVGRILMGDEGKKYPEPPVTDLVLQNLGATFDTSLATATWLLRWAFELQKLRPFLRQNASLNLKGVRQAYA